MSANEITATQFISDWLNNTKRTDKNVSVIQAISDTTENGGLDESQLLRKLRELAKPKEEGGKA